MVTRLSITGPEGVEYALLDPQGTVLGRSEDCDIVLADKSVSRQHARISRDPFGRWIIEDTGSHNGVYVEGERVKAHAVGPGDNIVISLFTLSMPEDSEHMTTTSGVSLRSTISVIDKGLEEEIVAYKAEDAMNLSPALMGYLNELTDSLLKLADPAELYSEACRFLAEILDTLVAVVRLAGEGEPTSAPDILACSFGGNDASSMVLDSSQLHFSKRVLEAVRSTDRPVMAGSGAGRQNMVLTVVDDVKPHVVFCARVNEAGESIDALYIDMLQEKSPKEMFDFVEMTARQINLVQKNLFLNELEKQKEALRQANVKLNEKDRIKDEYVARVTHDIKGHLAAIQSCLYVGTSKSNGPLSEKQAKFLGRAGERTVQLTDFVKELLNLTEMRMSGNVKMEAFSLPECITSAVETVDRKAKDQSITLTSEVGPAVGEIIGDKFSITELLTNLLFNAVKYTPENKTVHLEAKSCDSGIQIDISDTGIGIPADEVDSVFDEFFRASNAKNSEKEGTGLGLSIVKQIVDRHGGEIFVKSQLDQGTTFTIILPKK